MLFPSAHTINIIHNLIVVSIFIRSISLFASFLCVFSHRSKWMLHWIHGIFLAKYINTQILRRRWQSSTKRIERKRVKRAERVKETFDTAVNAIDTYCENKIEPKPKWNIYSFSWRESTFSIAIKEKMKIGESVNWIKREFSLNSIEIGDDGKEKWSGTMNMMIIIE